GLLPYFVARINDDVEGASQALASFGPEAAPAVLPLCRALLRSSYHAVPAARALGSIGPAARAAAPFLEPLLEDSDPHVRFRAAEALWRIERHAGRLPAVLAALLSQRSEAREWPGRRPSDHHEE